MSALDYRRREHNGYLDDLPALKAVLKQWMEGLDLDPWGVAYDKPEIEEIECRSRDGFIPHGHNRGGFDLTYLSEVSTCVGGGVGPGLVEIDRQEQQAYEEARKQIRDEMPERFAKIPFIKTSYHALYDLGHGDLAERLSEIEREWMNSPVRWGVRAMYEGADESGTHTLMLYCSGNVCEYHGAFGEGSQTLAEYEIQFRTAAELRRKLKGLTKKIEGAF